MSTALNVPLQQSIQFARALEAHGADVAMNGPVILRRKLGRLGSIAFASRASPESVANTSVRILNGETRCPLAYREAGFRQIITPAHVAEWALGQPDLRTKLHPKWRNQLAKGETQQVSICETIWDGSPHVLFKHAERLARRRRFKGYPFKLLSAYAQQNIGDAVMFEAYHRNELTGACLILRHGATATYQTAWASSVGKEIQAPRLLLWRAACQMVQRGHSKLDLGCIETDRSAGLTRFKLGTGAKVQKLGGTWVRLREGSKKLASW